MRYVIAAAFLLAIVGGLVGIKFTQISSLINMGKEMEKSGPPPEAVGTALVQEQDWEGTLAAVGSVAAVNGVAISNDAAGVVKKISFESGAIVKQGQVLVELDTSVERAQLASAEARKALAISTVERTRALAGKGAISQAQLDADEAQLKAATTDAEGIRAQMDPKVIRAPFTGRLGIRNVNLGQYVNPGTALTVLEAIDALYVDFTLPQQRLADVKVGMPVRITTEADGGAPWDATVAAIDPSIDAATRNIKIRASVPNKEERLRPGMFVNVALVLPTRGKVLTVPAPAIVRASFGDSVFIVEDKKPDAKGMTKTPDGKPVKDARQQFVRVGESRGDFVAIKEGVKPGQEVVVAGAFKLRNGAPVVVDNALRPNVQLAPRPENR